MDKKLLHTVIDAVCAEQLHKVAIEQQQVQITYGELKKSSDQVARALYRVQAGKGGIVVVYLPAGISYVTSILAVNKAGAAFMPIEPAYPRLRAAALIREAAATTFITSPDYADDLHSLLEDVAIPGNATILQVNDGILLPAAGTDILPELPETALDGDDANYIIYTSGSTGIPKIIKGRHKSLSHFIHWEVKMFGLNTESRVPLLAPVTFDVSLRDIFAPLLAGGTLCIPAPEIKAAPVKLLQWIIENRITLMHVVPSVFRLLTRELEKLPATGRRLSLSHVLLAGEPLPGKDVEAWYEVAGREIVLVNLYGPSETTLAKIYHVIVPQDLDTKGIVPLGIALPNTVVIIENQGELCNEGVVGEILIKTPFISNKYLNDAALNNEKFVQNPLHNDFEDIVYRTGDLGKYLANGMVAFVGRMDNQVKIRGNRVELLEVEAEISRCPGITHAVVLALDNPENEKVLVCYYTANGKVPVAGIREYIEPRLPVYMHPSFFLELDAFPLNLNGKVNRKQLPLPEEMLYEKMDFVAPATTLEHKIAGIWKDVLSLKRVGVTNSFYELGGHSLSATRMVSLLYRELGKEITLKTFLQYATIRKLAAFLSGMDEKGYAQIPEAPALEHYPLSNAQNRLFILHQVLENRSAYNMSGVYKVAAGMNIALLEQAFSRIVERHEILRSIFTVNEGKPVQQVVENNSVKISVKEAGNWDEQLLYEAIGSNAEKEYDLSLYPLFDLCLFKRNNKEDILQFTIHHIISDGWSSAVILHELLHIYAALSEGNRYEQDVLPPLKVQYKDYACWQVSRIANGGMEHHRSYWRRQLGGKDTALKLPVDFPAAQLRSHTGGKKIFVLSREVSSLLRAQALAADTGLFTMMVALVKIWLCRLCDQPAVTIGCPAATRSHPELLSMAGLFLNYLVLYDEISYEQSFSNWLLQVRQTVNDAYEHQEYPYELIAEAAGRPGNNGAIDLYNVLLVMNNSGLNVNTEDREKLYRTFGLEAIPWHDRNSKLPLTLFIDDEPAVRITIEYSAELFTEQTIDAIGERLLRLAEIITAHPAASIAGIFEQLTPHKIFKEIIDEDF